MFRRTALMTALALAIVAFVASTTAAIPGDEHIALVRSVPAKDTVLTQPPTEVRLWFSGVPKAGSTSIKVVDAAGTAVNVMVMAPVADAEDGKVQYSELHGALPAGRYTVIWATTAADGAAGNGEIPFTVRTQ